MQYYVDCCNFSRGDTHRLGKEFGPQLIDNCPEALRRAPLYKDGTVTCIICLLLRLTPPLFSHFPTAPRPEVTAQGDVVYSEVVREGVWSKRWQLVARHRRLRR
jgi:fatty acid synthase subunit alpha